MSDIPVENNNNPMGKETKLQEENFRNTMMAYVNQSLYLIKVLQDRLRQEEYQDIKFNNHLIDLEAKLQVAQDLYHT